MRRIAIVLFVGLLGAPTGALAWTPLRAENPNVKKGNEAMAEERYADALNDYDNAARELPESREVQLNRGLALLAEDLQEPAKEAFTVAADPAAPKATRAAAYYNLGVAWARQGEALSSEENFEEASGHFREAAQAFKQSLRQEPGNRDAAWNLEYALQRIREEEEKQEQQEQEQNQDQEENQDDQQQDQEQNQDEQQQDQEQDQDDQQQDQQQDQNQDQEENQDDQQQDQQQGQEQDQDPQEQNQDPPQPEEQGQPQEEEQVPAEEVERFLDALEQNEESLPLQQARRRNAGRRPPEKDW